MAKKLLSVNEDHIIDLFNALGGKDLTMPTAFTEGLHPNDEGYEVMA